MSARQQDPLLSTIRMTYDKNDNVELETDSDRFREPEKKSIWEKIADGFKTANDMRKGFRKGVAEALFSTVEGIWNTVTHPVKTAKGIVYAILSIRT
ncbi:hypothetical protein [Bacillus sp. REN3]|uniref:hypothetical protein n=1 Tax=Bacillus sp. REN3 TaxID=2802440 RepID=UPI001AEE9CEC|nr:hypothetical protein [Bacillus sp. REN3]